MIWQVYVILIIVQIALIMLAPKPKGVDAKPASLNDFDFPTADRSRSIPVLWGKRELTGPNIIWVGDYRATAMEEEIDGGWFGGGDEYITGYQYSIGMGFALCYGEVENISMVRFDEKIAWEGSSVNEDFDVANAGLFGGEEKGGGVWARCHLYSGSALQDPDPYMETVTKRDFDANAETPAYRGVAYLMWYGPSKGKNLTEIEGPFGIPLWTNEEIFNGIGGWVGNSTNMEPMAFTVQRRPNTLGLTANRHKIGNDANPACMIYEICQDRVWGMGLDASLIDTAALITMGNTLHAEGFGLSMVWASEDSILNLLTDILRHIEGFVTMDMYTGLLRFGLIRNDYSVASLELLDEDNIKELNNYTKGAWNSTVNEVIVDYDEAQNFWQSTPLAVQDLANAFVQNRSVSQTQSFHGITKGDLASKVGYREVRGWSTPLAKFELIVGPYAWHWSVGDVKKVSWPELNIEQLVVRILEIDYGNHEDRRVRVSMIQDLFSLDDSIYGDPQIGGWVPYSNPPVAPATHLVVERPFYLSRDASKNDLLLLSEGASPDTQSVALYGSYYSTDPKLRMGSQPIAPVFTLVDELLWDTDPIDASMLVGFQGSGMEAIGTHLDPALGYNMIYMNGEWMQCDGIAVEATGLTWYFINLRRGLFNSTPQYHPPGTKGFFFTYGANEPSRAINDIEKFYWRVLTETASGQQDYSAAGDRDYLSLQIIQDAQPPNAIQYESDYQVAIDAEFPLTMEYHNRPAVATFVDFGVELQEAEASRRYYYQFTDAMRWDTFGGYQVDAPYVDGLHNPTALDTTNPTVELDFYPVADEQLITEWSVVLMWTARTDEANRESRQYVYPINTRSQPARPYAQLPTNDYPRHRLAVLGGLFYSGWND